MPPKKGDPKSAGKKSKLEESKKGGKDDKKGGKDDKKGAKKADETPAKGKDKKGKGKKPVSESEEGSEDEEEEVQSVEEESESEEEVVTKKEAKTDKGRGKAALKGASKAVAMKGVKPSKRSPDDDKENENDGKTQMKKGVGAMNLKKMSDVHIKGASKAMMGFAAEGQKKKEAKAQKATDAKSHLKGASKALTGFAGKSSPFGLPSKQQDKAKPKRNLKSTSRLFLRLSKKKKPPAGSKPLLGTSKLFSGFGGKSAAEKKPGLSGFSMFNKKDTSKESAPTKKINLSSLEGKGKMATEAKGLGGRFKGMFGKKKTGQGFKNKSWMIGRMAAATNWLTGRFLSSKGQGRYGALAGRRSHTSFANKRSTGRHGHYYDKPYEYDDHYMYEKDYHNREGLRGYSRQPISNDPYDMYGEEMDYDDEEWEDQYGYYDEEGNFYYDDELYYNDEDNYYYDYPYGYHEDEYPYHYEEEEMEYYYGEDGMLYAVEPELYGYYGDAMYGVYEQITPELYEDFFHPNMTASYSMADPYHMMSYTFPVQGMLTDPVEAYIQPAPTYFPHQQHFNTNVQLDPAETGQLYGQEQISTLPEPQTSEQFRVPRPQVLLFGKDRLEVETLPPPHPNSHLSSAIHPPYSPVLALNNQEIMSDMQNEQLIPTFLLAQPVDPTGMNQQQMSFLSDHAPMTPTVNIDQEYFQPPYPIQPPFSIPPTNLFPASQMPTPQFSSQVYQAPLFQDPQMFQVRQMPPVAPSIQQMMYSPLASPMASPLPPRRRSPLPSPQLSLRPVSTRSMASPSNQFSPHVMDFQQGHILNNRSSLQDQRPNSLFETQRQPSPPLSPPHHRRGMSIRAEPSLRLGRAGMGFNRATTTVRPQSPLSRQLASPQESSRHRHSPPSSPRLSFRQQPPPDAVPLPPTRPNLFKREKRISVMRHPPSSPPPSPQRHSPIQIERPQSPPQSFRPTSPRQSPSPSPSRVTRSSTRRMISGPVARNQVPMRAVKPSPANPYVRRRSRQGPPVTQQVAPFRTSKHSGAASPLGQVGASAPTSMLNRVDSRPVGIREAKRTSSTQRGFHRPVGRGQPLVRMPRNQTSFQSRESIRGPSTLASVPPQSSLKQSRPLVPQSSMRRMQSRPPSPQMLHRRTPQPSRSGSPMHLSHPPSPLPQRSRSPHNLGPTKFHLASPHSSLPHDVLLSSQSIAQVDYTLMEPGASPMLTNALQGSYSTNAYNSPVQRPMSPQLQQKVFSQNLPQQLPLSPNMGRRLQNPYLQNVGNSSPLQLIPSPIPDGQGEGTQQTQMENSLGNVGLSTALMQDSQLPSAPYSSPLQRNVNTFTNVRAPPQHGASAAHFVLSAPHLSSAMLRPQSHNTSLASSLQRHLSPAHLPTTSQQGGFRGSSPLLSGRLQTSAIQGSTFRLPSGTLGMSQASVESPNRNESTGGGVHLSYSALSGALQNPSLRQANYKLPNSPLVRNNTASQPSSSALSSALLNANVRSASYRLPDASLLMRPRNKAENAESVLSSPGLSNALTNANLHKAKFQLPEGSSLFSKNKPQAPSSPFLSGALLNTNIRGASYNISNTSLFKKPGTAETSQQQSLDLSNALRNQNLKSATYRLPDGTLMTRSQANTGPQSVDLSNALSKNQNLRGAKYRLPDGNIMTRLGAPSTPQPRSLNLSGALKSTHLQGASFRLSSSYAVVSPQVQEAGPEQHWAQGSGAEGLGMQQDVDVWGTERILPHGTVQNLNKWSMYRDGELLEPQILIGQTHEGAQPEEWNLNREGEPKGNWFDKVISKLNYVKKKKKK